MSIPFSSTINCDALSIPNSFSMSSFNFENLKSITSSIITSHYMEELQATCVNYQIQNTLE